MKFPRIGCCFVSGCWSLLSMLRKGNHENMAYRNTLGKKWVLLLWTVCFIAAVVIYRKLFMEFDRSRSRVEVVNMMEIMCPDKYFVEGIDNLPYNLDLMRTLTDKECLTLYQKFAILYEVSVFNASQRLTPVFFYKMKDWLGSNEKAKLSEYQIVIMVHDILFQRTTIFNPLRSKKPVSKSQNSTLSYLKKFVDESKLNCDFCKPINSTAEDVFGRIVGKYSVSASNAFKLGKWHGLFIPYEHNIFNIDLNIFLDLFNTSIKWFKEVQAVDNKAKYPVFFWDVLPHAGASQMHVHVHGIVGVDRYPGQFQDTLQIVRTFQSSFNAGYWKTLVNIHETLGLAVQLGTTVVLVPLVPRREHEIWLLSDKPDNEFFTVLFIVTQMYQKYLERYCYSMAGALPTLGQRVHAMDRTLPTMVIVGTRGDCSSPVSDVSSLELYLFNNVNTDPYQTMQYLKMYIKMYYFKYQTDDEMEPLWDEFP